MALIKCDECGRQISDKSLFCPGCGHPTHLNAGHPAAGEEPGQFTRLKEAVGGPAKEAGALGLSARPENQAEESPLSESNVIEESGCTDRAPLQSDETPRSEPSEESPAEVEEKLRSAVDEYEATLEGGAQSRRRNERAKVWVFVLVFLAVFGVIFYFYFTGDIEATGEEAAEEEVDLHAADTMVQSEAALPIDSVVNPAAEMSYSASTDTLAVKAPAPKAAPAAAAPKREIKVAPLSEQAGHAAPAPEPKPESAE